MSNYALVQHGHVVTDQLPAIGTLVDGRTVSGYYQLPDDVLRSEGWLPLVDPGPPAHDPETQQAVRDGYDIEPDQVTVRYRVEPLPEPPEPAPDPVTLQAQVDQIMDILLEMR